MERGEKGRAYLGCIFLNLRQAFFARGFPTSLALTYETASVV
jgi:hypothetical protein